MLSIIEPIPLVAVTGKMLLIIIVSFVFNLFIGIEASCEILLSPKHGTLHILGDSKVDSIALYSCDEGWKLVGASASKCLITGQWTSPQPKCVAEKVSSFLTTATAIAPTAISVGLALPKLRATPFENEKQDPATTSNQTTQENNCSCTYNSHDRKLSADVNGLGLCNGNRVRKGDKITLRCYDQTKHLVLPNATSTFGTLTLTCDACRIWEDSDLPSCEDVRSGSCVLSAVPNGSIGYIERRRHSRYKSEERFVEYQVGEILKDGQTAIFRCKNGFAPIGSPQSSEDLRRSGEVVVTCKDSQWSQSLECKPESCYGEPPPMDNGYPVVYDKSNEFGIYYRCNKYYVKITNGTVKCTYGNWTGHTPTCIDGRCYVSQLNHPGLKKPPVDFIEHGQNYQANCMKGFMALPEGMKVSCDTGKWKVPDTICTSEDCTVPWISNGYIEEQIFGPYEYNWFKMRFEPKVTYRMVEVGSVPSRNATLFLVCRDQYSIQGANTSTRKIICSRGRWSPNAVCLRNSSASCPRFALDDAELDVEYDGPDTSVGSRATFSCRRTGQKLIGTRVSTCLSSKKWSSPLPQCTDIMCREFEKSDLMTISYTDNRKIGSFANFHCFAPGIRSGVARTQCLENGEWKDSLPICSSTPGCPPFAKVAGSRLSIKPEKDAYRIGEIVTLSCVPGYKLSTDLEIVMCLPSGWTEGALPECIKSDASDE